MAAVYEAACGTARTLATGAATYGAATYGAATWAAYETAGAWAYAVYAGYVEYCVIGPAGAHGAAEYAE